MKKETLIQRKKTILKLLKEQHEILLKVVSVQFTCSDMNIDAFNNIVSELNEDMSYLKIEIENLLSEGDE